MTQSQPQSQQQSPSISSPSSSFFLGRLASLPHVFTFAGQSTPWADSLTEQCDNPSLEQTLRTHMGAANRLLAPVADELLTAIGRPVDVFAAAESTRQVNRARRRDANVVDAATSVPGIALAQLGAYLDLAALGYEQARAHPVAILGHSQGVIAQRMVEAIMAAGSIESAGGAIDMTLAIAQLIGSAATHRARLLGVPAMSKGSTAMLSVKGARRAQVATLIERMPDAKGPVTIGVTNGPDHHVLSGFPSDLNAFAVQVGKEHRNQAKLREEKIRGGAVFDPVLEYLDVTVPFHSPLMSAAIEQCTAWAQRCGLDVPLTRELAHKVLVEPVNWAGQIREVLDSTDVTALWIVDLGPGNTTAKLTTVLAQGSAVGIVQAATASQRLALSTMKEDPARTQCWADFAPKIIDTPAGEKISTAFSRLTGKSPILLAGMTPTTVEPQIVAAAANAGYWAELAGGGQVTAQVFDRHMATLKQELDEGCTIEFNAMFMDRYLWNLQFGSTRIVPRKRATGAPIDGVTISAGIPELDEAVELVAKLHADGFPYVAFKPGTVEQIRQVVRIAKSVTPTKIIMQVEGGAAGGHHSWESLDDLLISTYADVRGCTNIVLVVGGGIGTPERAADYISGSWSRGYDLPAMPVDGVLVGTAAMTAREAHTSEEVKQLLVATPGITGEKKAHDPFAPHGEQWVSTGKAVGGVSSGLSHLHADIYEIENSSARCGRLLVRVMQHPEELDSRRDEIIAALDSTAKPYFGDLQQMTYQQWAERFVQLAFPWADNTYADRFLMLLRRIEARLCDRDSGLIESLFDSTQAVRTDPYRAIQKLCEAYQQAGEITVTPADIAWFPTLVRSYAKPMPFVPVIDHDLLRWWGQDQLWQSEDPRYSADSVRVIPGPISVAGITTINEPIASILGRFEQAVVDRSKADADAEHQAAVIPVCSQLASAGTSEAFIRNSPHISWMGHITTNPAYGTPEGDHIYELKSVGGNETGEQGQERFDLIIHLDTFWDDDSDGTDGLGGSSDKHVVRQIGIPLIVDASHPGRIPLVDSTRLPGHVYAMLEATAGIGNTTITGDRLEAMPEVDHAQDPDCFPYGRVCSSYTLSDNLGPDHESATAGLLPGELVATNLVADALVGPAWPAIYAALGSVIIDGVPVIEGLLNAVHLDHLIELDVTQAELATHVGQRVEITSWADHYSESISGRIITIHVVHSTQNGRALAHETERFAIRGRAYSDDLPQQVPDYGDYVSLHHRELQALEVDLDNNEHRIADEQATVDQAAQNAPAEREGKQEYDPVISTPRRLLRRITVQAPHEMTAFARTSGDYNPIHTSARAAAISGLGAPLVHGMWLSATAQHVAQAVDDHGDHYPIIGWTYSMVGMVHLDDEIEISVERVGKIRHAGILIEVICRVDGQIVSRATGVTRAPISAFVYPGQGIQQQGMVLGERAKSPAARRTWERADALTRSRLGFSILAVVRDNPKELTANGVTYRHPDGLLNLTQFTQVALATVAFAQTARLREAGCDVWPAYFAGHSLGEYNALSSFARIIPLETVLELVFHRGSTMHHLIERDEHGQSNYRMGALRPNQFGLGDDGIKEYIDSMARQSGEFLEIVNYNLAGQQYAIAGTIKGLKFLQKDAGRRAQEYGGKPPFMLVPGIDVPFHSTLLRKGVPEFRETLNRLLPEHIDYERLVDRYIPNLVARPFAMTREFAASILDVVPSTRIQEALEDPSVWRSYVNDSQRLGRLLLTELLSWQFASPVRWIETQALLFDPSEDNGHQLEQYIEVGLGNAPTLANLAARTLKLPQFANSSVAVVNVGRDESRVYMTDTDPTAQALDFVGDSAQDDGKSEQPEAPSPGGVTVDSHASSVAPAAPTDAGSVTPSTPSQSSVGAVEQSSSAEVQPSDITFRASDAIEMLLAYTAKIRPDQIGDADTTDTLTNGVSSRRNQLLMDISAELGVASVDGAAEATMAALKAMVNTVAPHYKPFGTVLGDIVRDRLRGLFGPVGIKQADVEHRVEQTWALGSGWAHAVVCELVLETREGSSSRGGDLGSLCSSTPVHIVDEANQLIDAAVQRVAYTHGVSVTQPSAGNAPGSVVDSAALDAFAAEVTGSQGILASTARFILNRLGVSEAGELSAATTDDEALIDAVSAELGSDWPEQVAPRFDANKAVLFDDRWASAREDLARIYYEHDMERAGYDFTGLGRAVADEAHWFAGLCYAGQNTELALVFEHIAEQAASGDDSSRSSDTGMSDATKAGRFTQDVAVITGVAPDSIAAQVVARLLAGGATVIATSHSFTPSIKQWARGVYRAHAAGGAKLWLVPANLTSFRDVDALIDWVGHEQSTTSGVTTTLIKPAYEPTLFFPFAAPPMHGTLADSGALFESQTRLMLWGVERAISQLSAIGADTDVQHTLHVVLPGSPNRGMFGGDGAYGEIKSAFDAMINRSRNEHDWADRVTFAHPKIGWVHGTGLMKANDALVEAVEHQGVTTYTTDQIAEKLVELATPEARERAAQAPLDVDLTGGLAGRQLDIAQLRAEAELEHHGDAQSNLAAATPSAEHDNHTAQPADIVPTVIKALPSPHVPQQPPVNLDDWRGVSVKPEDEVVIVSVGELGPWGSGRTRHEAELGIHHDGQMDLNAGAVLELAWNMGLLTWQDSPKPGWYDSEGSLVPEEDIAERFHDEVVARSGIRPFEDGMGADYRDGTNEEEAEVYLDHEVRFTVPTKDIAEEYRKLDPEHTSVSEDQESNEWQVIRAAGSMIRVPRRATMSRTVGGQFPKGFDPAKWGIPASLIGEVDQIALWNIVTTVDAYLSAGFTPIEILQAIHPSMVASTQGTGFGGMASMRKLYLERFLNHEVPNDVLQEALPNVVAAHVMQSYIGGYGSMVQPVSACATAAVSVEEGVDKITLNKADFVVTGAIDDIGVESVIGFGNMNATANSAQMYAKGIEPRFFSRANDRRRDGFVESQGGGTILITRGDIALRLGLPVAGVVAYAHSFADGAHTSIPAPGLGALAAGMGGTDSRLVHDLERLSVSADDIAVVSKHDTSTNANDPNESELHNTLAHAIGRNSGNPLFVISQKSLTGHAKGGACVFQINGILQLFESGVIPANISLDCVDAKLQGDDHMVWLTEPMRVGSIKAALATSLGFGHVGGFLAIVHPGAFEASVAHTHGMQELERWRERAGQRRTNGQRRLEEGMMGLTALYEPIQGRRFRDDSDGYDAHETEKAMLLNPEARLGSSGFYEI